MTDKPYGARKSTQNGRCWSVAQTPAAGGASSVSAGRPCPLGRTFPPVRPCLPRELRQGLTSTARRQGATRGGRLTMAISLSTTMQEAAGEIHLRVRQEC